MLLHELEVDFIANKGNQRAYVQSALTAANEEKGQQEINSLVRAGDSFREIVVVRDDVIPWYDENRIFYIGIEDFLLNEGALGVIGKE